MSYEHEVAKEYLRNAFMAGTMDASADFETLKGFVRIFAGEMEATIAIDLCSWLSPEQEAELIALAKPTEQSVMQHRVWAQRISQ